METNPDHERIAIVSCLISLSVSIKIFLRKNHKLRWIQYLFSLITKKYTARKQFRFLVRTIVNIFLPIVLQVLLSIAALNSFRWPYVAPFTVVGLIWFFCTYYVYSLEEKIPESTMETQLAESKNQAELAQEELRTQILKYESLKSLIESIHKNDIRGINQAIRENFHPNDFFENFDIRRQISYTVLQIAYYLNKFPEGKDSAFRVTFMEPVNDNLFITYWSSWPDKTDELPERKANNKGLGKGEGCAGRAWSEGEIILIPSIGDDQKGAKVYKLNNAYRKTRTKSLASIPIKDTMHEPHEIIGVLNVDSDEDGYFAVDGDADLHPDIEEIQHFFHLIVFYKRVEQFFKHIKHLNS